MKVARPDNPYTDGPTSHVAVLLNMPDCWILIDTTHLQYDLPYAYTDRSSTALRATYLTLISGFQPFIFYDRFMEPVLIEWRNFISGKPKVKFMTGAEILDKDDPGTRM